MTRQDTPREPPPKAVAAARETIDRLVDWYTTNKPGSDVDIRVDLPRTVCERFCTQLNTDLFYRGHRIVPLKDKPQSGRTTRETTND